METIKDDYQRCESVIRENSKTFYKAFSLIGNTDKRNAVFAVYAFCRMVDDAVDRADDPDLLDRYERELNAFKEGETPDRFVWRALRDTAQRFYPDDYDYGPFFDQIQGQRLDIEHQGYRMVDDLLEYCYLVASSVGLMLLPILSPENAHQLRGFALELGYAMQLTNILRDVGEDARNNRVYLPSDLLSRANITVDDLIHGRITDGFIAVFEELAGIAEDYYEKALAAIDGFPADVRLPLGASILFYRAIIAACREAGYDVFTRKNYVSDAAKAELVVQAKSLMAKGENR
ncbi:MAG: phytoene/squalene synthase family protein [Acholeplasmataceae bacterium]